MRHLIFFALLAVATAAQAALYKQVEEDGSVTFTDVPPSEQAEALELPPVNTMPAPPASPTRAERSQPATESAGYTSLSILAPTQDQTLRANNGRIAVELGFEPALAAGHRIRLMMDGQAVASVGTSSLVLENVARGTHELRAVIVDADGRQRIQSDPVTFHVQRHSILH